MANYDLNSITHGGNTYNLKDNSKIPLSGTSALSGTSFFKSTSDSELQIGAGTSNTTGGCFIAYGSDLSNTGLAGSFRIRARTTTNYDLAGYPSGALRWGSKGVAMEEDTVPRSGGAVLSGNTLGRNADTGILDICGGTQRGHGAYIALCGASYIPDTYAGLVRLNAYKNSSNKKEMELYPNGTWTWSGQAVQLVSDQRLKQQITQIDNALLDAWEDVNLVQFKYNNAVDQKGDNARLHTGYVVQQIDEACKKHNVDISEYGLFCHEEYPEETEEIEVEQADGTKTKERKVIREANEHYSLRYTEALIVECAYLRKCIKELRTEIEQLKSSK